MKGGKKSNKQCWDKKSLHDIYCTQNITKAL